MTSSSAAAGQPDKARRWDGPCLDPATGILSLDGTAVLRSWEPGIALHNLIAGPADSGKTTLARWLVTEYLLSGVAVTWLGIPHGNLLPEWEVAAAESGRTAAGVPQVIGMLRGAVDLIGARSARRGGGRLVQGQDLLVLKIVIDDVQRLLGDPEHGHAAAALCAQITSRGRFALVGLDLLTEDASPLAMRDTSLRANSCLATMMSVEGRPGYLCPRDGVPHRVPLIPARFPAARTGPAD